MKLFRQNWLLKNSFFGLVFEIYFANWFNFFTLAK